MKYMIVMLLLGIMLCCNGCATIIPPFHYSYKAQCDSRDILDEATEQFMKSGFLVIYSNSKTGTLQLETSFAVKRGIFGVDWPGKAKISIFIQSRQVSVSMNSYCSYGSIYSIYETPCYSGDDEKRALTGITSRIMRILGNITRHCNGIDTVDSQPKKDWKAADKKAQEEWEKEKRIQQEINKEKQVQENPPGFN